MKLSVYTRASYIMLLTNLCLENWNPLHTIILADGTYSTVGYWWVKDSTDIISDIHPDYSSMGELQVTWGDVTILQGSMNAFLSF